MTEPKGITMSVTEAPPVRFTNLKQFMNNFRSIRDRTHTSIKSGSWDIPFNRLGEFHDLYHEYTIVNGVIDKFAYMTERPMPMSCIKVDIDMRWDDVELVRRYDLDTITDLLQVYYDVLRDIINCVKDEEYHAFVFEKKLPSRTKKKENQNKDGLHIMWPFLNVTSHVEELVRERVMERIKTNGTLDKLGLSNKLGDIIDKSVCGRQQCWQMYGSRKPNCEAYRLTHIFTIDPDDDELTELPVNKYSDRKLLDILSLRIGHDELSPKTLIKTAAQKLLDARYPVTVPVNIRANKKTYSSTTQSFRMKSKVKVINEGRKDILGRKPAEQLKDICDRVKGLNKHRVADYKGWHKMGQLLYNIHNADDTLLDAWIEISKSIPKYKRTAEAACRKEWTKKFPEWVQERPPGIGTLNMWLKVDNPKLFNEINKTSIHSLITASIKAKILEYDVARVLHAKYNGLYKYIAGGKGGFWYEYTEDEHRWKELKDGTNLRAKISTELFATYRAFQSDAINNIKMPGDWWDEKREASGKVMNKLKSTAFKNNLMKEAAELFNDTKDEFYKKLDSTTKLIGFTNGVYDLEASEFRDGRPEDYISFSTGIRYLNYDETNADFMYVVTFLNKVIDYMFPKNCPVCTGKKEKCRLKDYVLLLLSTFLDGSTKDEQFHIWVGGGGNGKSLLVELFQDALGDYAGVLDNTVITTKRTKSGNATPELFDTKNKRFIVIQETEKDAQIQAGLLKQLTGGDKITARGLYKDIETFKPQFKMVLVTNNLPKLPPDDGGIWRRVRATEFRSKFMPIHKKPAGHWINAEGDVITHAEHEENVAMGDEISDTWIPDKNEYPGDNTLKDKFKAEGDGSIYKEVFLSMLINMYNRYKRGEISLVEPACVMECTRKYQLDQDKIQQFIEEYIVELDTPSVKPLLINAVWDAFQKWSSDNYPNERGMPKRALQEQFEKKYGKYKSPNKTRRFQRGWYNIRLQTEIGLDSSDDDDGSVDSLEV